MLYSDDLLTEMETLQEESEYERLLVLLLEDIVEYPPAEIDALRSDPNWSDLVDAARTLDREAKAENEYEFDAVRCAELITPTVLLTGSESPGDLASPTEELDDALPGSRIVSLDGQGYDGIHTAPDLVIKEVLAVIRESH